MVVFTHLFFFALFFPPLTSLYLKKEAKIVRPGNRHSHTCEIDEWRQGEHNEEGKRLFYTPNHRAVQRAIRDNAEG